VQNEEADLDMYKEFMVDIVDEIDRESQIINDLLTLVKTDKESGQLNMREVDINSMLEIIVKRVTPLAQARGIDLGYENYRDVTARVDDVKLSLALSNIIENAVKYNIDNGWIKVTLNADSKNFHIKVADSGVGIPDDCKDKVFERFYRVDKARSRDTGGTGLGLAITRNIVHMHNGSIKLYSESGVGTTFTIKIPINMEEVS
jgi:signal transduction histidine kinase